MVILANAFSLQMIKEDCSVSIKTVSLDDARAILSNHSNVITFDGNSVTSAVGHADTASVVSALLSADGTTIVGPVCNRINVSLNKGDTLVVAQVMGGRLPEGSTTLPEGFSLSFKEVTIL